MINTDARWCKFFDKLAQHIESVSTFWLDCLPNNLLQLTERVGLIERGRIHLDPLHCIFDNRDRKLGTFFIIKVHQLRF